MPTSLSLRFITLLFLSSTLAFGQIQRPNPNLRFCGDNRNDKFIPETVCKTKLRTMMCVQFAAGAPHPQFCSTGVCAIEAGEDGVSLIDSQIYNQMVLVGYLYKPEREAAKIAPMMQEAFKSWETWKARIDELYALTLKAKSERRSNCLKSPEFRAAAKKFDGMAELLTTIRLALEKAKATGMQYGYLDAIMFRGLEILCDEEERLTRLGEYFRKLANGMKECPKPSKGSKAFLRF